MPHININLEKECDKKKKKLNEPRRKKMAQILSGGGGDNNFCMHGYPKAGSAEVKDSHVTHF